MAWQSFKLDSIVSFSIRAAVPEDGAIIARIKVEGWRAAYKHFVKASTLENLDIKRNADRFEESIRSAIDEHTWVAESDGKVIGFAVCGPNRHGPEGYTSELYAIYIDPAYVGGGIGSELTLRCAVAMREDGHTKMAVYCFGQNAAARQFYEAKGAVLHNEAIFTYDDVDYQDCCYVWESLDELIGRLSKQGSDVNAQGGG